MGCAFAICLEKKQKRGVEAGVTVTYNQNRTSFERTGSFRQTTLTERIADPQSAILAGMFKWNINTPEILGSGQAPLKYNKVNLRSISNSQTRLLPANPGNSSI